MRTQIYDHRSGLKVVPNDIVADVKNIIWNINPALSKKTVSSLKESVRERLEKEGWTGEYRLDATSRITISSYLRGVGLCFQTGNVGRIYADLLKLQTLYKSITTIPILLRSITIIRHMSSNKLSLNIVTEYLTMT